MADNTAKVTLGVSASAAIMAALAWKNSGKAQAAQQTFPPELMDLIVAITTSTEHVDATTVALLNALTNLILPGGSPLQGWPPNAERTRSVVVAMPVAGVAVQAPDITVPDGMALLVKSHPGNALASLVFVATGEAAASNPNSAHPLILNEPITFQIKNANVLWVSTNVPGSQVVFTAEQRS